jgi:hypothetical protein
MSEFAQRYFFLLSEFSSLYRLNSFSTVKWFLPQYKYAHSLFYRDILMYIELIKIEELTLNIHIKGKFKTLAIEIILCFLKKFLELKVN